MTRSTRKEMARHTVEITERGAYVSANGQQVDITQAVQACVAGTRLFEPETLDQLRKDVLARPAPSENTAFEVVNETTLSGIRRLLASQHEPVAALNFASAKNPGGGFLNGSEAQEESLARSSALHASLLNAWDFYERHRVSPSLLYSDTMILTPDCPIFRDDDGTLLEEPLRATFFTSPAPNAGAVASNQPHDLPRIPDVLFRRSEYLLALAASLGYQHLVLGAWGCGVFRNAPEMVAATFARHLRHGAWAGRFQRVVFSVLDRPNGETFAAFQGAFTS